MKIVKKLIAMLLIAFLALTLAVGALAWRGNSILAKPWQIEPVSKGLPVESGDPQEGERIAQIRGCKECHGPDLGGQVLAMTPIGALVPPNLTRGQGSVTAGYSDVDWQRAVRHGVGPGGRALIVMPSDDNTNMSDADFASLMAYIASVPPVDRTPAKTELSLLGKILLGAGQLPLLTVERIDHRTKPQRVEVAASVEYGAYLAQICAGCHRADFSGGPMAGMPPEAPPAGNLTPAGEPMSWTLAQFGDALRHGRRPDGRVLQKEFMPWPAASGMTDMEVEALYKYFHTLPPVASAK